MPKAPAPKSGPLPVVRLYTKEGCTLCDDALRDLERVRRDVPFGIETVDIAAVPELIEEYGLHIPVIRLGEREISRYRLDREALVKALKESAPVENDPSIPRPEEPSIRGFLVVLAIAVLALAVTFVRFPKSTGTRFPEVGQPAPVFEGRFLTGEPFSLAAEKGKRVIILNFWASWCDPCIKEMPDLEKLYQKTKASGVELVAVNQDTREAVAREFTERLKITMPVIWDDDARIAKQFGTFRYPETYVIDLDGNIAKKIFGPVDWTSDEVVNFVLRLAEKGGKIDEAAGGAPDPLQGGSREQMSDRTRDVRSSPN